MTVRRKSFRRALSRSDGPPTTHEVEVFQIDVDLRDEILEWFASPSVRACGEMCPYAADFEITEAFQSFFPEDYEGQIRRNVRTLRAEKRLETVNGHVHRNPVTHKNQQCYRLPRRIRRSPLIV